MSEATDWKLPRPAVVRSIVADEPSEPLTEMEQARLCCHSSLRHGYPLSEWLTVAQLGRLSLVHWERARGHWMEG